MFGMVSRLAEQKGIDVLSETLGNILCEKEIQFVGLGSGDLQLAEQLKSLQDRFPNKFAFENGYSNELAHQIEAGADYFVMPSRFEPCGLNQMYSLRYGTIPIVNGVGGLVDTVRDVGKQHATGLVLNRLSVQALSAAFNKACDIHGSVQSLEILKRGMKAEYGWRNSSNQYLKCYQ